MIWHAISDADWARLEACASAAEARWAVVGGDRKWNPDRHLLGCAGEWFVSSLLDLPWDPDRLGAGADGGRDLGDTDVKCYRLGKLEMQYPANQTPRATWYVVALLDYPDPRRIAIAGHTHLSELLAAPILMRRIETRCLPLDELAPGLPPHLVLEAYRRRRS